MGIVEAIVEAILSPLIGWGIRLLPRPSKLRLRITRAKYTSNGLLDKIELVLINNGEETIVVTQVFPKVNGRTIPSHESILFYDREWQPTASEPTFSIEPKKIKHLYLGLDWKNMYAPLDSGFGVTYLPQRVSLQLPAHKNSIIKTEFFGSLDGDFSKVKTIGVALWLSNDKTIETSDFTKENFDSLREF